METYYRVWLANEYCENFPLFVRVEASKLEAWLRENAEPCEDFGKTYWIIDHRSTAHIRDDIPYNSMGYIVKYERID